MAPPTRRVSGKATRRGVPLSRKFHRRVEPENGPRTVSATAGGSGALDDTDRAAALSDADTRSRIEETLARMRDVDAEQLRIRVDDHVVTLRGTVRCWSEHEIVERVAWSAPGVVHVRSKLVVMY